MGLRRREKLVFSCRIKMELTRQMEKLTVDN